MLTSCDVAVVLPAHLHARPAGALVRAASRFASTVELSYGDKTVNARGILAVLGLGATAGTRSWCARAERTPRRPSRPWRRRSAWPSECPCGPAGTWCGRLTLTA
jgi:phosphotransferase system HPr (HPr) family protein